MLSEEKWKVDHFRVPMINSDMEPFQAAGLGVWGSFFMSYRSCVLVRIDAWQLFIIMLLYLKCDIIMIKKNILFCLHQNRDIQCEIVCLG